LGLAMDGLCLRSGAARAGPFVRVWEGRDVLGLVVLRRPLAVWRGMVRWSCFLSGVFARLMGYDMGAAGAAAWQKGWAIL